MVQTKGWSDWFPVVSDSGYGDFSELAHLDAPKAVVRLVEHNRLRASLRRALRMHTKITFKGKCK